MTSRGVLTLAVGIYNGVDGLLLRLNGKGSTGKRKG